MMMFNFEPENETHPEVIFKSRQKTKAGIKDYSKKLYHSKKYGDITYEDFYKKTTEPEPKLEEPKDYYMELRCV